MNRQFCECELPDEVRQSAWENNFPLPVVVQWTCPCGNVYDVTVDESDTFLSFAKETP